MARYLEMSKQQQLQALIRLEWPERRIARELGLHRNTVRRYKKELASKCTKTPADSLAPAADATMYATTPRNVRRPFKAAAHEDVIWAAVKAGDGAQVIYQTLVEEHRYRGSYDSVKRYVRHLRAKLPRRPVGVMHHAPGEEGQIDYFQGAPTRHPDTGEYKRPWVFRMTMGHSRHGYEEPVWKLDLPAFLRVQERAFRALGGVPRVIRHDNIAAGVSRACYYDPDSNKTYLAFAAHWGFAPLPTRPYSPQENGKQERSGGYCKRNAYRKDQRFASLEEHGAHLRHWNQRWAGTRVHGTTRKQVYAHFLESDRPALQPCPSENFAIFSSGTRKVHMDGHVEVAGSFYPVPLHLLATSVHVRWDDHLVRIFHDDAEVALHARVPPGRWALRAGHDNAELSSSQTTHLEWLKRRCGEIGPELRSWADAAHEERGIRAFKLLQGILALAKKHSRAQMLRAASSALDRGQFRYDAFKRIAAEPLPPAPDRVLIAEHPMIRPLDQYSLMDFIMSRETAMHAGTHATFTGDAL